MQSEANKNVERDIIESEGMLDQKIFDWKVLLHDFDSQITKNIKKR